LLRPLDEHEKRWIEQRVPVADDELKAIQSYHRDQAKREDRDDDGGVSDEYSDSACIAVGRGIREVVCEGDVWYKLEYLDSHTGRKTDIHPKLGALRSQLRRLRLHARESMAELVTQSQEARMESLKHEWDAAQRSLDYMYDIRLANDNRVRALLRRQKVGAYAMRTPSDRTTSLGQHELSRSSADHSLPSGFDKNATEA